MDIEEELKNGILECYEKEKNHMKKYMKITETDASDSEIRSFVIPDKIIKESEIIKDIDYFSKKYVEYIKQYELEHFGQFLQDKKINSESKSLLDISYDIASNDYTPKFIYLSPILKNKIYTYLKNNNVPSFSEYLKLLQPINAIKGDSLFVTYEGYCEKIYPISNRFEIEIKNKNNITIQCMIKYKLKTNDILLKKITVKI